jgi:hypothetical protein
MEEFLKSAQPAYNGSVTYGDGKPHCWGPERTELIKIMVQHIRNQAPLTEGR